LDFVLQPAFAVEGRVVDGLTGAPIRHFEAALSRTASEDAELSGMVLRQMQPLDDPAGRFSLTATQPGHMVVAVRVPGYATEWQYVTLSVDHPSEYVELSLLNGGDLHGFVRDTSGTPIKGAHILY